MFERLFVLGGVLMLSLVLLGCGKEDTAPVGSDEAAMTPTPAGSPPDVGPYDPGAETQPDLMRVEPAEARAGAEVQVLFPEETERGVAYVLEKRFGDAWDLRYYLSAAAEGHAGSPAWAPVGEEFGWDDIGIGGPGPDRIVVPDTAGPGEYRLCTANARSNFCAELVVVE